MGDKMECPGCESETSTLLAAYERGDPCPYCGLSVKAMDEIIAARRKHADDAIVALFRDAICRGDRMEQENRELKERLRMIRRAANLEEELSYR